MFSKELEALLSELLQLEMVLNSSSTKIRSQLAVLSCDLEGRQFVKANKITNGSCNIASETCINVELLKRFLTSLLSCIKEYSMLFYEGD